MKYRVELSARAESDVDETLGWLSRQGAAVSVINRWHQRLLKVIATLERNPQRCALAPEADEFGIELRELLFGRRGNVYRVFFVIEDRAVNILHVRHAARDVLRRGDLA